MSSVSGRSWFQHSLLNRAISFSRNNAIIMVASQTISRLITRIVSPLFFSVLITHQQETTTTTRLYYYQTWAQRREDSVVRNSISARSAS